MLAGEIAAKIGADVEKAKRAARLCKADLTTGVVGEFPELQGVMGRYYALHDKEDAAVADAIRDHYKPVGPVMRFRRQVFAIAVALADKLDTLVEVFRCRRKADWLRRSLCAATRRLGVIRIVLEHWNVVHDRTLETTSCDFLDCTDEVHSAFGAWIRLHQASSSD